MSAAIDWAAKIDEALRPPAEELDPGFEWLETWGERFKCSDSNAFLLLRKLVAAGKMERRKYRCHKTGRPSYRSAWKWLAD